MGVALSRQWGTLVTELSTILNKSTTGVITGPIFVTTFNSVAKKNTYRESLLWSLRTGWISGKLSTLICRIKAMGGIAAIAVLFGKPCS